MSLSDNELENEYKEQYWVIRAAGFDTEDPKVESLVKQLIEYYYNPEYTVTEQEYEDSKASCYDEGFADGYYEARTEIKRFAEDMEVQT